jgi:uncharacterized protein YbjT (DUF2867 family)
MKIVILGGTGLIGAKLVNLLRSGRHEVIATSPSLGVNSITGEGLTEALTGAQVVVDVTNAPSWEDNAVLKFFETSTRNVLATETKTGVGHHIALSISWLRPASCQRILTRESCPGKTDQGFANSVHDCPRHAVF